MSNKYYTELLALLEGESSAYRYPGEILERCTMAGGTDKDKVLKAFLDATQPSTLVSQEMADKTNACLRNEQAFNSNQIDSFIRLFDGYEAELLRFRLTGEVKPANEELVKTADQYKHLIAYVYQVEVETQKTSLEGYFKLLGEKISLLYGADVVNQIEARYLKLKLSALKLGKADAGFVALLCKATEAPLKDTEVKKLLSFGYTSLSARRMNVKSIWTGITGRKSKAEYEYLHELLYGAEPAREDDWEMAVSLINGKLDRAINGKHTMYEALIQPFDDSNVNAARSIQLFSEQYNDGYRNQLKTSVLYKLTTKLPLDGTVFQGLDNDLKLEVLKALLHYGDIEQRKKAYATWMKLSTIQKLLKGVSCNVICLLIKDDIADSSIIDQIEDQTEKKYVVTFFFKNLGEKSAAIIKKHITGVEKFYYTHTENYKEAFKVTFDGATKEQILELYAAKEKFFYTYQPELYAKFLTNTICTTEENIHLKTEWKELLPELEAAGVKGWNLTWLQKSLFTEAEFQQMEDDEKREAEEKRKAKLSEKIEAAQKIHDIPFFSLRSSDRELSHKAYEKFMEMRGQEYWEYEEKTIAELFYDDAITETELMAYIYAVKKLKKEEEKN